MDLGISGKRAAVAAASAGLGYSSAKALVENGVRVVMCGRDRARIEPCAASLGPLAALVADVGTFGGGTGSIAAARAIMGGVEIVIANAVGPPPETTERITKVYSDASNAAAGIPAGVPGDPADFGQVVAFPRSQQARSIMGAAVPVDGGAYAGLQ